jgi:hypothetical protein
MNNICNGFFFLPKQTNKIEVLFSPPAILNDSYKLFTGRSRCSKFRGCLFYSESNRALLASKPEGKDNSMSVSDVLHVELEMNAVVDLTSAWFCLNVVGVVLCGVQYIFLVAVVPLTKCPPRGGWPSLDPLDSGSDVETLVKALVLRTLCDLKFPRVLTNHRKSSWNHHLEDLNTSPCQNVSSSAQLIHSQSGPFFLNRPID